jgi:hypothetical protein
MANVQGTTDISTAQYARFFAKATTPTTEPGCWLWSAGRDCDGYGVFWIAAGIQRKAHRIAYEIAHGPIPAGLLVCHACDTPACVNPARMFLGTHAENHHDRDQKGRQSEMKKTHCPAGHPYAGENLISRRVGSSQWRKCRQCEARHTRHTTIRRRGLTLSRRSASGDACSQCLIDIAHAGRCDGWRRGKSG